MNLEEVVKFLDGERLGALATVTENGSPQAALMGVAVTPELELIFDNREELKEVSKFEEEFAGGVCDWLQHGSHCSI